MSRKLILIPAIVFAMAGVFFWPRHVNRSAGPMSNDVYVWQRAWTDPLKNSIAEHATNFSELIVLAAEISWPKGQPNVVRAPLDYAALRTAGRPIGLALRIGGFSGALRESQTAFVKDLGTSLLAEAASNALAVAELQVDFDCPELKLEGYRLWVEALKSSSVPVTITALPSWLKHDAFKRLIATADGYVLQVHSLERPKNVNTPFVLCDIEAARHAVERAAQLGKPFRVALPTYGYLVAFDASGNFEGILAESPAVAWPDGTRMREVRADPAALAGLIRIWAESRPELLKGMIWYRLPIPEESLNWAWPTLETVMAGKIPNSELRSELRYPKPGLVEIDLMNTGTANHIRPVGVTLQWHEARLVACDGLQGFEAKERGNNTLNFRSKATQTPFEPGERRMIGWLRLSQETEVRIEMQNN
jgi:hypothetical protein